MNDLKSTIEQALKPLMVELGVENDQLCAYVDRTSLLAVALALRDNPGLLFNSLLDIVGIDTLPLSRPYRFKIVYVLKSLSLRHRLHLCVLLPDNNPICPSITPLYSIANWLEREVWDQFGIVFEGHPNLKRLLNHKEFIGHPLRKDYPVAKRQALSHSDDLLDEMKLTLTKQGRSLESVRIAEFGDNANAADDTIDQDQTFLVNLGPAHPIAHGVLRFLLALEGETIVAAVPEIGYLHRGAEKSCENGNYHQVIPYTDRLNYASPMMNNVGYCKAVEKMLGIQISERDMLVRVILCELGRIMDHLLCTGPHLIDLGALTPFWYLFKVRENIYDIMEKYSGARLTYSCIRIGTMPFDINPQFADDIEAVLKNLATAIDDTRKLVERNRIFYDRCCNVGAISQLEAISYGFTGPCLRATGCDYDLRKAEPYYLYDQFDFSTVIGTNGDTYDRFFVRIYECIESTSIIRQALSRLQKTPAQVSETGAAIKKAKGFKKISPPAGEIYDFTEAANGELGFYIVSDGSAKPFRVKFRSPSLAHFSGIERLCTGGMISDLVSIVASLNIIGGEIDR